jgi:hypothetical protein
VFARLTPWQAWFNFEPLRQMHDVHNRALLSWTAANNNNRGLGCGIADDDGKHLTQTPLAPPGPTAMPLLRANIFFLLALPLRIRNLPDLHAGEHLGHVLQSYHMGLPGLRAAQRIRKSMSSSNPATTFIIENSYGRFADLVGRMRQRGHELSWTVLNLHF